MTRIITAGRARTRDAEPGADGAGIVVLVARGELALALGVRGDRGAIQVARDCCSACRAQYRGQKGRRQQEWLHTFVSLSQKQVL
jgi:hypothetical protein